MAPLFVSLVPGCCAASAEGQRQTARYLTPFTARPPLQIAGACRGEPISLGLVRWSGRACNTCGIGDSHREVGAFRTSRRRIPAVMGLPCRSNAWIKQRDRGQKPPDVAHLILTACPAIQGNPDMKGNLDRRYDCSVAVRYRAVTCVASGAVKVAASCPAEARGRE